MIKLTSERALEDLKEVARALVTKGQVSGVSRKEALEIVAQASEELVKELRGRANGTIEDEE